MSCPSFSHLKSTGSYHSHIVALLYCCYRNPLEVSEDFVQDYNNAKDLDEKEKLEQSAQKMLERAKVRH